MAVLLLGRNVFTPEDRVVVHFGSPQGTAYGSRETEDEKEEE